MRTVTSRVVDYSGADPPRRARWRLPVAIVVPGLIAALATALVTAMVTPPIDDLWNSLRGRFGGSSTVKQLPFAATIECAEYCVTERPKIAMRGTVTGQLPPGHSLRLMVFAFQRDRWYPDTKVAVADGRWTAQIHSGPNARPSVDQQFKVCIIDAGPEFDADLSALVTDVEKVNREGLERPPVSMRELACVTVTRLGG